MKKLHRRTPVVFYVGCGLLCLALFSTSMTGGLYARFSSTATGNGTAQVAIFDVRNTLQSVDTSIDLHFYEPNRSTDSIAFSVTSGSEVSVKYDVIITLPEGADYTWLEVQLVSDQQTTSADPVLNTFTFSDVGQFDPKDESVHNYTVTFTIKLDYAGKPPSSLDDISDGQVTITVHAEQVD